MTIAIICSSLLAALVFGLGANVTRKRVDHRQGGRRPNADDPASRLLIAIRAHGNAAEYVPVLIVFVPAGRRPQPGLGGDPADHRRNGRPVAARVRHAHHATSWRRRGRSREVGASMTYLTGLGLAVAVARRCEAAVLDGRTAVAPLRSPAFRRYLMGQLPSVTCSWAQVVAVAWVVVQHRPSGARTRGGAAVPAQPGARSVARCGGRPARPTGSADAGRGRARRRGRRLRGRRHHRLADPAGRYRLAAAWGVLNALDTPARRSLVPMLVPRAGRAARPHSPAPCWCSG